jgi:hypothetical protein
LPPHPRPLSREGRGENKKEKMRRARIPGLRFAPTWAIGVSAPSTCAPAFAAVAADAGRSGLRTKTVAL